MENAGGVSGKVRNGVCGAIQCLRHGIGAAKLTMETSNGKNGK